MAAAVVLLVASVPVAAAQRSPAPILLPGQRILETGERLDFESGTLFVPEHHAKPKAGRLIAIPFERYRARQPSGASPIFLLAGGPGDSALDRLGGKRGREDLLFYSEFADV